jgi:hypothetical protein
LKRFVAQFLLDSLLIDGPDSLDDKFRIEEGGDGIVGFESRKEAD